MTRCVRRTHALAFKAKVTLPAVKGEMTLADLAQLYDVHPNQITTWKAEVMEGVAGLFGPRSAGIEAAPAVDVRCCTSRLVLGLDPRIGELTLEVDFLADALGKADLLSTKQ
jgi:transposase